MRSSSADALRQIEDDHSVLGVGFESHWGTVEQACTTATGTDGESLALLVLWQLALRVA